MFHHSAARLQGKDPSPRRSRLELHREPPRAFAPPLLNRGEEPLPLLLPPAVAAETKAPLLESGGAGAEAMGVVPAATRVSTAADRHSAAF